MAPGRPTTQPVRQDRDPLRRLTRPQGVHKPEHSRRYPTTTGNPGWEEIGQVTSLVPIIHNRDAYKEGTIFSVAVHEHDRDQPNCPQSSCQSVTQVGIVNSKYRKFVVVRSYGSHCLTVPIFTHAGRGLSFKSNKHEYISIRDWDIFHRSAPAESHHGILWAEACHRLGESIRWYRMTDCTSIHITSPHSHKYGTEAQILGELRPESTRTLVELFDIGMVDPDGLEPDEPTGSQDSRQERSSWTPYDQERDRSDRYSSPADSDSSLDSNHYGYVHPDRRQHITSTPGA